MKLIILRMLATVTNIFNFTRGVKEIKLKGKRNAITLAFICMYYKSYRFFN